MMMYVIKKKTYYAVLTDKNAVQKTTDPALATYFASKEQAEGLLKKATSKLKGFQIETVEENEETDERPIEKIIEKPIEKKTEKNESHGSARKCFSLEERNDIYAKSEGRCAICGAFVRFDKFTIDHIIPLAKGGTNDHSNLQCTCQSCNRMKQDILPEDLVNKLVDILGYQMQSNKKLRKKIRKLSKKKKK
jgi:5-methylcytosine-specific restriction endonuclease McrA